MHLSDCKGTTALVLGGVCAVVVGRLPGTTKQRRLDGLNVLLKSWYDAHPGWHRLPKIRLKNLVNSQGWAELRGPAFKAANTRAAVPAFLAIAAETLTTGSEEDRSIVALLTAVNAFQELLYSAGFSLTDDEIGRLDAIVLEMGFHYQTLRGIARAKNQLWWRVTPKVHKLQHMSHWARVLNPAMVQCYMEESMVGTTTKVWQRTMSGRYQSTVQAIVLLKRVLGLLLRIHEG